MTDKILSDISYSLRCIERNLDRIYAKTQDIEMGCVDYETKANRRLLRFDLYRTEWDYYVVWIDDNTMRLPDQPDDYKGNLEWAIAALIAKGEKPVYPAAIEWSNEALNLTDDDKHKWYCFYVRHFARWRIGGLRHLFALYDIFRMARIDPAKSDLYGKWKGRIYSKMRDELVSAITKGIGLVPVLVAAIALAEWLFS